MAIDNIWDTAKSIDFAQAFLKANFHKDSIVIVAARSQRTLELLQLDVAACIEMPELGQGDATKLFLHYAANGQEFTSEEDMRFIDICVKRCYISKGNGGLHYHPATLEDLGRELRCQGKNPFECAHALLNGRTPYGIPMHFERYLMH